MAICMENICPFCHFAREHCQCAPTVEEQIEELAHPDLYDVEIVEKGRCMGKSLFGTLRYERKPPHFPPRGFTNSTQRKNKR